MNNFALSQIGQIAIPVGDLERAVEFYRDKLGMKHIFTVPNQFTFFDCGGVRLLLGLPEKGETNRKTSLIYYTVNDIQEAYEILKKREVHFDDEPHLIAKMEDHELWMAFFRDCDNNQFGIMAEVKI